MGTWAPFKATAQEKGRAELLEAMGHIKSLRTYSFEGESRTRFPDGRTETLHSFVAMDARQRSLLYKDDHKLVVVNPKWAFKALHKQKKASVFDLKAYQKKHGTGHAEIDGLFDAQSLTQLVDSLLLKNATIKTYKRDGNQSTFVLAFPERSPLKEAVVVFDHRTQMPHSIRFRAYYAEGRAGGAEIESESRNYSKALPTGTFQTAPYFQVRGGKAVLERFKNYTLTTIL